MATGLGTPQAGCLVTDLLRGGRPGCAGQVGTSGLTGGSALAPARNWSRQAGGVGWPASGVAGPDPKADLLAYLQAGREALLWKLDGLSEYDIRRPLTPTGTNLLGLVKHVASVELGYFGETFAAVRGAAALAGGGRRTERGHVGGPGGVA